MTMARLSGRVSQDSRMQAIMDASSHAWFSP